MSSGSIVERRPGLMVTLCGIGVSALTLLIVHWLNEVDFNLMGIYANGIIPAGALFVGVGSGLGFALASRYLQIALTTKYVIGMIFTGLVTYVCAQYETYLYEIEKAGLYEIEKAGIAPELYGFTEYLRDVCEQMTFGSKNPNVEPKPLGKFGYVFKCLEMIGFVAGSTIPAMIVSNLPYCKACQKYLKPHREGHLAAPQPWAELKKLSKKDRTDGLNQAIAALRPHLDYAVQTHAQSPLAEVEAYLATMAPKADKTAAAGLIFVLKKCPTCEAHQLTVKLHNFTVDKTANSSDVLTLKKLEPPTASA